MRSETSKAAPPTPPEQTAVSPQRTPAPLQRPIRNWVFRAFSPDDAKRLEKETGATPLVARLLAARGLTSRREVTAFLRPELSTLHEPLLMRDMDRAVERLARAVRSKESLAVFGDYDADGLTATALLTRFFQWLGLTATPYVPNRLSEGYGMSREGIDVLHARGIRLIVTVDNGINCLEETAYAYSKGMEVVITDHHQPGPELPVAAAVVDPHRADCPYPFKDLSGVGLAFKLAHALAKELGKPAREAKTFLKSLLDLVALGTVADVMPLVGENRALVYHGLKILKHTRNPGLGAMVEMLGIPREKPFTSENIAFMFAPRLNAAGRTGNATDGLEMLLTDEKARAAELARHLDGLNQDRRNLELEVLEMALEQIEGDPALLQSPVLVTAGEEWHQGVVGIVAARLVDRYGRPAIVLGTDSKGSSTLKGSARSTDGFDIRQALAACEGLLQGYGGHKMAAGMTLPIENLAAFRRALTEYAVAHADPAGPQSRLELDAETRIEELTFETLDQIENMRPFGQDNPAPLLALMGCEMPAREPPAEIGTNHLKLRLVQPGNGGAPAGPITAMWFNCPGSRTETLSRILEARRIDVAGNLRANVWNSRRTLELTVKDIRPSA